MKPEFPPESFHSDLIEEALGRVNEALAVLDVVHEGDLLGELPSDPDARVRHQQAVCLLAVLKRDLVGLAQGLEAAWVTAGALNRASSHHPRRTS